jgi:branched-chain amino acid transport system substrate-binding protein
VPSVIRVGALLPLTGDLAKGGAECLAGMRLAVEEVNAGGGIHSLGGLELRIAQADTKGDADTAQNEYKRLVSEDRVCAVVGAYQSSAALSVGQVAEAAKVPFIVSTGAADEITENGWRYTFRLCPKAEWYARDQVAFLADGGLGTGPVTKVALLHEDGPFGSDTGADQRKYLEAAGIEVVDDISYPADQADFSADVLQIKASEAQAILTATYLDDAVLIVNAARKLHMTIPIVDAGGGTADPEFPGRVMTGQGGTVQAPIFTEREYCPGTSAVAVESEYKRSGGGVLSAASLYAYQAVRLLANALERVGTTEGERLRAALITTAMGPQDHMVLPQPLLTFAADGQNRSARLFIAQIDGLRCVPVWPKEYAQTRMP